MVDSTIHLGDIILFIVGGILIPYIRNNANASNLLSKSVTELVVEMRGVTQRVEKLEADSDKTKEWVFSIKNYPKNDK